MNLGRIVNWNVGGAKYLELPSGTPRKHKPGMHFQCREEFRAALNHALQRLIENQGEPMVVCLQEIVQYEERGYSAPDLRKQIVDPIPNYEFYPLPLIDTEQFGATAKWMKVRIKGKWKKVRTKGKRGSNPEPFFAQGNGFLVHDNCQHFSLWALPKAGTSHQQYPDANTVDGQHRSGVERVDLHPGLYFGDRNTEPRAAFVQHIVMPTEQEKPLDMFIVNVHLTTLKGEREGVPDIDERASQIRINQLKVVLDNCVSQYNQWRGNGYRLREGLPGLRPGIDSGERFNPVWVLAGDFNFTPDSAEYQYLTRRNFIDLIVPSKPTKAAGLGKDPTITVDYLFAGPRYYSVKPHPTDEDLAQNGVQVDKGFAVSDHYPLVATVPYLSNW